MFNEVANDFDFAKLTGELDKGIGLENLEYGNYLKIKTYLNILNILKNLNKAYLW